MRFNGADPIGGPINQTESVVWKPCRSSSYGVGNGKGGCSSSPRNWDWSYRSDKGGLSVRN
eukprot:3130064-Pyramimonas_sp.AAC.2